MIMLTDHGDKIVIIVIIVIIIATKITVTPVVTVIMAIKDNTVDEVTFVKLKTTK